MADSRIQTARLLLRLGLAFVFLYAAGEVYFNPEGFWRFIPDFVQDILPKGPFLTVFGLFEIGLAVWLLSGWRGHLSAGLAAIVMLMIIICNPDLFSILFRNVAIGCAALALAVLEWPSAQA